MNSQQYPEQVIPLQEGGNERFPNQQGGPVLVQHTTVSMTTEPPKDHIIWSLCCFVCTFHSGCCCLGLAALIFSVKARDRKVVGDLQGARHYGNTAAGINLVSTILISLLILGAFIGVIVVIVKINQAASYHYRNPYSG